MSGEDGEVDDGPPVLTAFEYSPEDNGNEMPLDNEDPSNDREINEDVNNVQNANNDNDNNDGTPSEDEGEASQQDAEAEEGEDQESKTSESKSRRGSKRRHHRRSSHHRKQKESSKSLSSSQNPSQKEVPVLPVDAYHNKLVGAPVGGEWATLLNMYQQQFPPATGDEGRGAVSKPSPSKNNQSKTDASGGKSQYEVDDVDPYGTPHASDDEQALTGPQVVSSVKEPLSDNIGNATYSLADYHNYPPADASYPPRKRMRDESFGGVAEDRSSPFRSSGGIPPPGPRDRCYYNDRGGRRQGGYDDYYDDRRGSRSPGEWRGRRDRGGMGLRRVRDRHDMGGPFRRPRNQDYNDYDQPPPNELGPGPDYESRHYDGHYGLGPQEPSPYHPSPQDLPPYQPPPPPHPPQDFERSYPPPESYDEVRHGGRFRGDEDSGFDGSRGGRRGDRGMGRRTGKNDRIIGGPPGVPLPPPEVQQQQQPPPPQRSNPPQDPPRPGMICKFFREGNCLKGSNCNFAHILPSEIKRKPELCKFYLSGFCIKGNDCDYLHEQFPCKFFHTSGNCRNGDHCRFSHAPLDEEGRKMLDKAVASWGAANAQASGEQGGFYPPEDQQQQQQQQQLGSSAYPPPPQQFNGNGSALPPQGGPPLGPPPGFYGVDLLGGGNASFGDQQQNNNSTFQSPPQNRQPYMGPPGGFEPGHQDATIRPPFEPPILPFHGDFIPPPPPNFPPMPPFVGQPPVPLAQPPYYPSPADLSSPPQFRPPMPGPAPPGFPPSSPSYQAAQMPPLPPTLSAEQIHLLASGMPGMPPGMPPPPFAQSPPTGAVPPQIAEPGATSPTTRDPRLNINRTSGDANASSNSANKVVRYKLISVLIPPPVPLSLALRLDPMDPIIRLDPRLRKVFGVATTNP